MLRNTNMNNFIINKILFVGIYDTFNSIDTKKMQLKLHKNISKFAERATIPSMREVTSSKGIRTR